MSRKDIAAAIKSCNDRIRELESKPEWCAGKRQRKRAIQLERMKIEALALAAYTMEEGENG